MANRMKKLKRRVKELRRYIYAILIILLLITVVNVGFIVFQNSIRFAYMDFMDGLSDFVNPSKAEKENTLYFQEKDIELMNQMYNAYENEYALCFNVNIQNNVSVIKTKATRYDEQSIRFVCPEYAEMTIHSHPDVDRCVFSSVDKESFDGSPFEYMGIVCGENIFKIVNKDYDDMNIAVVG